MSRTRRQNQKEEAEQEELDLGPFHEGIFAKADGLIIYQMMFSKSCNILN
jgi:hypothetical protein